MSAKSRARSVLAFLGLAGDDRPAKAAEAGAKGQAPAPMGNSLRAAHYARQNGTSRLTARQERRMRHKAAHRKRYGAELAKEAL